MLQRLLSAQRHQTYKSTIEIHLHAPAEGLSAVEQVLEYSRGFEKPSSLSCGDKTSSSFGLRGRYCALHVNVQVVGFSDYIARIPLAHLIF